MTESVVPIIKRPKRVNRSLQGPCLDFPDMETGQQPIWGNAVRIYHGRQDTLLKDSPAPEFLLHPGKVADPLDPGSYIVEPRGDHGTSYTSLLCFVRACVEAGAYPWQVEELLSAGLDVGPCAQYRWQEARKGGDWFAKFWIKVCSNMTDSYYLFQLKEYYSKETSHGLLTIVLPEVDEDGFRYSDRKLEELRCYLRDNPGKPQKDVIASGPVHYKVATRYLAKLKEQGRATYVVEQTGKRGQPPKVWSAVLTDAEIQEALLPSEDAVSFDPFTLLGGKNT